MVDLELVRFCADGGDEPGIDPLVVEREGLEGMLVARRSTPALPAWHSAHISAAASTVVAWCDLQQALATLAVSGVEPAVLPGAALLRYYPDAGCRPMDDIDLLCPPGQIDSVRQILRAADWESVERHPDLLVRGTTRLDLHEDLFHCERIRSRRHAGWLDPQDVWTRCRRRCILGVDVLALSVEDEILYTAAHALRHSYRRLTWLVDLAVQLREPELDATQLWMRADASGLTEPLRYGIIILESAGVDVPAPIRQPAGMLSTRRQRLLQRIVASRSTTCLGEILWCCTSPSWPARLRLLTEFAFPRSDVLLQVFPSVPARLAPLTHVLRVAQFIGRGLREAGALVPAMIRGGQR